LRARQNLGAVEIATISDDIELELMMVAPLSARSVLPDYVGLHGSLALSLTRG
jgi:hypothetical protein